MIRDMGMHQYLLIIVIAAIMVTVTDGTINTNDNNGNGVSSRGSTSRSGGEVLIFADDFTDFDLSKWEHEITMGGGGNWEFEYYSNNRSNSYVKNGVLYIKPTLTSDVIGEANVRNNYRMDLWGAQPAALCTGNAFYGCERTSGAGGNILNPIQSARLRTSSSMNVKYGRIEVNAKLPSGDWIWPAIWMMPRYNSYGNWPASGEIDIMESRGNDASYPAGGRNAFSSTLHWGPFFPLDPFVKTHAEYRLPSGTFADSFHTFGMYWNDSGLYTYIDNPSNKVLQVNWNSTSFWQRGGWDTSSFDNPWAGRGNGAPFDREFYLILNVAVGGIADYFPDGMGGKPWSNRDAHAVNAFYDAKGNWYSTWSGEKTALQVDWVKVWQLQ